jgi:type IV pilus assembly protein PilC
MRITNQKRYQWSGITLQGHKTQGICEAPHLMAAKQNLQRQGIAYIKLRGVKYSLKFSRRRKISFKQTVIFYRQLATLIAAGVPLTRGLGILSQNHSHDLLNQIILALKYDIEKGNHLSAAMSRYPKIFDSLTCHLIHVGEHSGALETLLLRVANHKEKSLQLKNKIKQALFYPTIITLTAIVVALTLLIFVVPQFSDLFENFHAALPTFTRQVIKVSYVICHYYGLAIVPILLAALFAYRYQQSLAFKLATDKTILKTPILGQLVKKFVLARFTRTLATIVAAGTPINDGLKMLIDINHNQVFKQATKQLQTEIAAGQSLHKAMRRSGIFPVLVIQMIQVGEESGSLEQMLEKIAAFYESEIDYTVTNFSQLLEPLIIIILGVLIGGLVIAMYLPIFKLGTIL